MVEATLSWSPLTADDLIQVAHLCEATDYFDDPAQRMGIDEVAAQLEAPGADPTHNGVVGRDRAGAVLAAGWLHPRGLDEDSPRLWMEWRVHPAARHRQIGKHLVSWLRDRGLEWYDEVRPHHPRPRVWMGCYVDHRLHLRRSQMVSGGFVEQRWHRDMHVQFADDSDVTSHQVDLPDDVVLVPFDDELSERVRHAHNEVFAASQAVSQAEWEHSLTVSTARPQWSWVALRDGEVVGYAMSSAYEADWQPLGWSEGWTDRIGVRADHRELGIGEALVIACLASYRRAGLAGAGCGVDSDNPNGAERLFHRLGYVETDAVVLFGQSFA